jgi:hypothetical protein
MDYPSGKTRRNFMKFKRNTMLIGLVLVSALAVGCTQTEPETDPVVAAPEVESPDVITTASIVNDADAFQSAISKDGSWIIAIIDDLTIDAPLVLDGDFLNGKKDDDGNEIYQRKVALYSQDADRNITARYTLTAPQLTVNSINASIQHGTFVGDLYIEGENFKLIDAVIEGNVYFMNEEAMNSFEMDEDSSVSGVQELKQ